MHRSQCTVLSHVFGILHVEVLHAVAVACWQYPAVCYAVLEADHADPEITATITRHIWMV